MNQNKITVVLPTRNRVDTLKWSLATCVEQDYENLEILVSDNESVDDTRAVVESFRDPRIRYIRTGKPVTMVENFEFALSHVEGGYVSFIGDDDGMVPDACTELNRLINEYKCEAIGGRNAIYNWPGFPVHAGILSFDRSGEPEMLDSRQAVMRVLNYQNNVYDLPVVYYGCVHHNVFKRAKSAAGKFFNGVILDYYSGFAVAAVTERYLSLNSHRPIFIVGASTHSTGLNSTVRADNKEASTALTALNYEAWQGQRDLADAMAHVYSYYVAESFAKARDAIPNTWLPQVTLNYADVMRRMMQDAAPYPPSVYATALDGMRQIAAKQHLENLVDPLIAEFPNTYSGHAVQPVGGSFLRHYRLYLQTQDFGIKNVYQASLLCHHARIMDEMGFIRMKSRPLAQLGRQARGLYRQYSPAIAPVVRKIRRKS